jgi:hypothetical protein
MTANPDESHCSVLLWQLVQSVIAYYAPERILIHEALLALFPQGYIYKGHTHWRFFPDSTNKMLSVYIDL